MASSPSPPTTHTDRNDTAALEWTLEQLLEDDGLIPEHLATRFASSGRIFGIGQTVLAFLTARSRGASWLEASRTRRGTGH